MKPGAQPRWVAATVLMAGLLAACAAGFWQDMYNQADAARRFDALAQDVADQVKDRLRIYEYGLRGTSGAVIAGGLERLTREQFGAASASRDLAREFPGARGFGLIRRVGASDEAAFVEAARGAGLPGFAVRRIGPLDGDRFVVQYLESAEPSHAAIGLDIGSESARRKAAETAALRGQATLTAPLTLVQAAGQPARGFLFLLPIFRPGADTSTPERRSSATFGWAYAPLVIDEVLRGLRSSDDLFALALSDIDGTARMSFYGAGGSSAVPGGPSRQIRMPVFGRVWEAELSARPAFIDALNQVAPRSTATMVGVIGLLLSMLSYLLAQARLRTQDGRLKKADGEAREFRRVLASQKELADLNASLERLVDERTQRLDTALRDLGAILDAVPSMIGYWDKRLVNRFANRAYADWFGVDPSKVAGMHFSELLDETQYAVSLPHIEAALRGEAQTFERTMPRVGGKGVRHALVHYLPDLADGEVRGFYVLVHDVSELAVGRQQLAALQRDNVALLGTLEKHAFVTVADRDGRITEVNDNFCRISGFERNELIGSDHRLIHGGVQGASLWPRIRQTLDAGQSWQGEVCHCASDGTLYWVDCVVAPFIGASGEIEKYVSIRTDITARKKAEEALVHERFLMNALLESLPDQIYFKDEHHRFVRVNPALARRLGFDDASQIVGRTDAAFYDAEHAFKTAELERAIMTTGEPVLNLEEKETWPDRPPTWNLTTKMALRDAEGHVIGTFGISRDITARKRMEDEVQGTNERFSLAADSVGLGVWEYDVLAGTLVWDERMYALYGRRREAAAEPYALWSGSLHAEDRAAAESTLQQALDGTRRFDTEFRIVRPDGEVRHVKAAARIVRNIMGQAIRMTGVNIDVTDRARTEFELRQTMALLHAVLDSATQASIIAVKPDGRISVFNSGAERLLGYRRDEVVGRRSSLDFHDRDELARRAEALGVETGVHVKAASVLVHPHLLDHPHEWMYRRKDGSAVPVSLSVTAMQDADGEHFGWLGIAHDISGQKQYEQSLRDAMHEAEQANRAKSQFLANMSHEIRTPMNAVIGLSYVLERTTLDGEQSALLAKIKLASKSLLGIINDVLDLSKVEAAEMRIERAPFSLESVLADVSGLMAFSAESKGIHFTVRCADDLPPVLEGDPVRIQQVLTNLLTNAIKFTEHGGVRLDVQVAGRTQDSVALRFETADTGIGIEAEALTRLFKPFVQADSSTTRRFGGTGLGLSIVKQLVTLMGGQVGASSEPGDGSLFWFELELPIARAPAPAAADIFHLPARSTCDDTGAGLGGVRVLVVDDSTINLEVARRILEQEGATVFVAGNGQEAVDHLLAAPDSVDVVLMDMQMPVLDGHDATRRIRAGLGLTRLPIIALTAGMSFENAQRAEQAGMSDVLGKPFDPPVLIGCIRRHVQAAGRGATSLRAAAGAPAIESWPDIEGIDQRSASIRLGGDAQLFLSLLQHLFDEAADLEDFVGMHDLAALAGRMHKLKSGAGMLGAGRVERLAAQTEAASLGRAAEQAEQLLGQVIAELRRLTLAAAAPMRDRADRGSTAADGDDNDMQATDPLEPSELAALLGQLRRADLEALDHFARLGPQLRPKLGQGDYAALGDLVRGLRFEEAADLLEARVCILEVGVE